MKRRELRNHVVCILLALVMLFSFTIPAFATETEETKLENQEVETERATEEENEELEVTNKDKNVKTDKSKPKETKEEKKKSNSEADFKIEVKTKNKAGDKYVIIKKYKGNKKNLTIPGEINGYKVEIIDYMAFTKTNVETVYIPKEVRRVQCHSFYKARKLKKVTFNTNCEVQIQSFAFEESSVKEIVLPDKVDWIEDEAFGEALKLEKLRFRNNSNKYFMTKNGILYEKESSKKISLHTYPTAKKSKTYQTPSFLTHINWGAFSGAKYLKKVTLSKNIRDVHSYSYWPGNPMPDMEYDYIGESVKNTKTLPPAGGFPCVSGENKIEKIVVSRKNKYYSSKGGVLFNKKKTKLILYPAGKRNVKYVLPKSVKTLEEEAFPEAKYLRMLVIPKNLKTLDLDAFYYNEKLKAIVVMKRTKKLKVIGSFRERDTVSQANIKLYVANTKYIKSTKLIKIKKYKPATKVKIKAKRSVKKGKSIKLSANVSPKGSINLVKYKIIKGKNKAVLKGNKLIGVKKGTVVVKVTTLNKNKSDKIKIKVK